MGAKSPSGAPQDEGPDDGLPEPNIQALVGIASSACAPNSRKASTGQTIREHFLTVKMAQLLLTAGRFALALWDHLHS